MAGDWIKMRSNLRRHPKIVRVASALNADRLRVVGGLHAVWCLFDEHSDDGQLSGYTPSAVDEEIGWPGFTQALIGIGWVEWDGNDGLQLPEFDTHNGASAKRRAQDADRKRAERETSKGGTQDVGNPSASDADKNRTREEKRRGELPTSGEVGKAPRKRSPPTPAIAKPDDVAQQTWDDWLILRNSKKAPVTETVLNGARSESVGAGMTLDAFLQVWCMRGSQGLQADWLKPHERQVASRLDIEKETAHARKMREAVEGLAPGIARRTGPTKPTTLTVDMEAPNVVAIARH